MTSDGSFSVTGSLELRTLPALVFIEGEKRLDKSSGTVLSEEATFDLTPEEDILNAGLSSNILEIFGTASDNNKLLSDCIAV